MKKRLMWILCSVLLVMLLCAVTGTALAAKKGGGSIMAGAIDDSLADWYYVPDSLPEGMEPIQREDFHIYLYNSSGSGSESEEVTSHEIVFKSGDEALKDALVCRDKEGGSGVSIYVDNSCLKAPGEAKFHIKLESDSFIYEKDFTLRVFNYSDLPLFETVNEHPVIEAEPGDSFFDRDLAAQAMKYFEDDIYKKLNIKPWNYASFYRYPYHNVVDIPQEAESSGTITKEYYYNPNIWSIDIYKINIQGYVSCDLQVGYAMGNVRYTLPVRINASGLALSAEGKPLPGNVVQMSVTGSTEGKTFTWSLKEDSATIDESTGALTIPGDAEIGTAFTVTASTGDGEEVTGEVYVNDGILSGEEFGTASEVGFTVPHLTQWMSDEMYNSYYRWLVYDQHRTGDEYFQADAKIYSLTDSLPGGWAEDPEVAKEYLAKYITGEDDEIKNVETDVVEIDGHPAMLYKYELYKDGAFYAYTGSIRYPRNTLLICYRLWSVPQEGGTPETTKPITMADLKTLASRFRYNESKAIFTKDNAAITISAKGDPVSVTAGKNVAFKAEFADKDNINKKSKNNTVTWSVGSAEDGSEVPGVTISDKGQLNVDKSLDKPVELVVKAASPIYGTEAEYRLSATPVISAVVLDPAEVFFYTGIEAEQTVKATLDPSSVPPKGVTWTPAKEGIVEITEVEDGVVTLKPVGAGKTTIAVKEPSGKNAKLNVSVVNPVTALTLEGKGKTAPGGTVTVKAALEPKAAGNKNIEWSLNVGEDIATVNAKGQVKISKTAPEGTKVVVTCKALGAPEPISAAYEFEVTAK